MMRAIKTGIYLDTSALLPYCRPEALSVQVQEYYCPRHDQQK
ncbi:MAG: type II toxin-antitoxin system VapC family toxin [Gammaproteobacteria bacterium]|nr:type II toxin-antitoxin system VapC family toxin [Gammaproteobacteria bacterium]